MSWQQAATYSPRMSETLPGSFPTDRPPTSSTSSTAPPTSHQPLHGYVQQQHQPQQQQHSLGLGSNAHIQTQLDELGRSISRLERLSYRLQSNMHSHDPLLHDQLNDTQQHAAQYLHSTMHSIQNLVATPTAQTPEHSNLLQSFQRQLDREFTRFQQVTQQVENVSQQSINEAYERLQQQQHEQHPPPPQSMFGLEDDESAEDHQQLLQQQQQSADNLQNILQPEMESLERRQAALRDIERQVLQLSHMYTDLQQYVNQQQTSIDILDDNIQQTQHYAAEANSQLNIAEDYERQRRRSQTKICLVLTGIAFVFISILRILS